MSKHSKLSVPISIPRRKSAHPPPRSPIRAQASSPDLMFNLDFSISPGGGNGGWEEELARLPAQQRGRMNMLLFQRERNDRRDGYGYAPFGVNPSPEDDTKVGGQLTLEVDTRPYGREPFLYTIPKLMLRNTSATHLRTMSSPNPVPRELHRRESLDKDAGYNDEEDVKSVQSVLHARNQSASAVLPTSMTHVPSNLSVSLQHDSQRADTQEVHMDVIEVPRTSPLTTAFQRPLVSSIVTNAATSTSTSIPSSISVPSSPGSPSEDFRPPTPVSPPRNPSSTLLTQRSNPRLKATSRGRVSLPCAIPAQGHIARTPAAPIVSFKVVEADRGTASYGSNLSNGLLREPRGRSPYPSGRSGSGSGSSGGRGRRSSSAAGTKSGTVLGTGRDLYAGRSVSAVLSCEELERSLLVKRGEAESGPSGSGGESVAKSTKWERGRERERGGGKGWMRDIWARRGRPRLAHEDEDVETRAETPVERW